MGQAATSVACRPPAIGGRLWHYLARKLTGATADRAEQGPFGVLAQTRAAEIIQVTTCTDWAQSHKGKFCDSAEFCDSQAADLRAGGSRMTARRPAGAVQPVRAAAHPTA